MNAVTAYATWTERFPHVEKFDPARWEMVMGTASVFVALQRLPDFGVEKDRGSTLTRATIDDLKDWAPGMIASFRDCRSFYFRTFGRIKSQPEYVGEPQLAAADALDPRLATAVLRFLNEELNVHLRDEAEDLFPLQARRCTPEDAILLPTARARLTRADLRAMSKHMRTRRGLSQLAETTNAE